jgi:hypothetical protein
VSQLAARIFQVSPNEPLELVQFGRLVDQDILGDPINLSVSSMALRVSSITPL